MDKQYGQGIHNHYCMIAKKTVDCQIQESDRVWIRSNNPYCKPHLESALSGQHEGWIVIQVIDVAIASAA